MSKLQELGSNEEIDISETNAIWRIKSFLISLKTSKKIHYRNGKQIHIYMLPKCKRMSPLVASAKNKVFLWKQVRT